MTTAQINFVSRVIEFAKLLNGEYGNIVSMNALWYGAEDYNDTITTEALQTIPAFASFTNADLNELMYIVGQLKGLIDARLEPIAVLSQ